MNSKFSLLNESPSFSLTWQYNYQLTVHYQYGRRHKRNYIDLGYMRKSLTNVRENEVCTEAPHHWVTSAPFASQVITELFGHCNTPTTLPPLPHPLPNDWHYQLFCSVWSRSVWPHSSSSLFLFVLRRMKNSHNLFQSRADFTSSQWQNFHELQRPGQ